MNNNIQLSEQSPTQFKEILLFIDKEFADNPDLTKRRLVLRSGQEGYFIFFEDTVDLDLLQRDFIYPLSEMTYGQLLDQDYISRISASKINFYYDLQSALDRVLQGEVIFIFDGMRFAVACGLKKFDKRAITEPDTEKNVRGSHEGFVETISTNTAILRRRIKNSNLKFKTINLGTTTNQTVLIAYIEGIANPEILDELYNRIKGIDIDGLLGSGYIEQLVSDFPNSPFPQFIATERSDKVVSYLLEGRLAVIVEGTPMVIVAPITFSSFFHAPDDYNTHWIFGTFLGALRAIAVAIALFLPGIYISVTSFHYYLVPIKLLIPLAESRERVPFPPFFEAVIMEFTIEMLREASIRLPTYIGTTIGVIGGIIIGQAAVQAGIVSVLMIIVVSVTAIASYVTPIYDMGVALRFYRFVIMVASSVFGIIGILSSMVFLIAHLLHLESLGQPYFAPISPFRLKDLKDTFVRLPLKYLKKRPSDAKPLDKIRGKKKQ